MNRVTWTSYMELNLDITHLLNEDNMYATLPGGINLFAAEINPDVDVDYQFNVSPSTLGLSITYEPKR